MHKFDLTKEQKKKLAKRTRSIGTAIPAIMSISILILIGMLAYDVERVTPRDDILLAISVIGLIISAVLIIRKRKVANAIFDGATEVYKVLATIEIRKSLRGDADISYAHFEDSINYNPPKRESVIFADTDDASEFYDKIMGNNPVGLHRVLENVEVIIVMKGNFRRAFSMLAIE